MHNANQTLTYFAPSGREPREVLARQAAFLVDHPLTDLVLESLGGIVCVLNSRRQIVAANTALMDALGLEVLDGVLGMRPGEALGCAQVADGPDGCGTSRTCAHCGAVLAILACARSRAPEERDCLMVRQSEDGRRSWEFRARAIHWVLDGETFTLLTLRDIRREKAWETLHRTYLHDLRNLLMPLSMVSLKCSANAESGSGCQADKLARVVDALRASACSAGEFAWLEPGHPVLHVARLRVGALLQRIDDAFAGLQIDRGLAGVVVHTDEALAYRVLANMVSNAVEANAGEPVRVWCELDTDSVLFRVWNRATIPESFAPRVFQPHYTTKPGEGRGLGASSMKTLGEGALGGRVDFKSDATGTTFTFALPLRPPA